MPIYNRLLFWVILGFVGSLLIGFIVSHFYDGETGGKAAAIYILIVAIAATIQIIRYQRRNP
jgi:uncharacterized membrane protein YeaQ/YmgE (transglycosylase-associated protein family)